MCLDHFRDAPLTVLRWRKMWYALPKVDREWRLQKFFHDVREEQIRLRSGKIPASRLTTAPLEQTSAGKRSLCWPASMQRPYEQREGCYNVAQRHWCHRHVYGFIANRMLIWMPGLGY